MEQSEVREFEDVGFVVLRRALDPQPLSDEIDRAFSEGFKTPGPVKVFRQGTGQVMLRYLPMMCERTPLSLRLADHFASIVGELLTRKVLPGRIKATRYYDDTGWHRDNEGSVPSVAFVAYLEALGAETGALRVLRGSHANLATDLPRNLGASAPDLEVITTEPGDVVAFDENLIHSSKGGQERRQWRVDFVADPNTAQEEREVRAGFQHIFRDTRDPDYDTALYPSYGPYWQSRDRPWNVRLRELGVYDLAALAEGR